MQSDKDVIIVDSMIKTVNQLYKDIQLQDGFKNPGEEDAVTMETSKSIGGEIFEENNSEVRLSGEDEGNDLERSTSAPPRSLPHPVKVTEIRKLQGALRRLKRNLKHMKSLQTDLENELDEQSSCLRSMVGEGAGSSANFRRGLTNLVENDLETMTMTLLDLINKKTVSPEKSKKKKLSPDHDEYGGQYGDNNGTEIVCVPALHANDEQLKKLAVFRKVRDEFKMLAPVRRICLLSFAVFPENQEVNRTMLMYWWIGEDILPVPEAEDDVKDILNDFMMRKLIEPVENKRKVEPNSYKMTPFVHSSVVLISQEIGLFDMYHKGEKPTMRQSVLRKVCLVEDSSNQPEARPKKMPARDIETIFNVSERFPDFSLKWFSSTNCLKVLYLGRWERAEREIEVDSRRVMKDLSSLSKLRFLSFQGILTIKRLSRSVCKLTKLVILDLRGCGNLEELPESIHKLKTLVFLDMTGCTALERIPIGLASLSTLEVLKGFVVTDDRDVACKLSDIKRLSKLRKLSVTVDREDFGLHELIVDIKGFDKLEKLKVWWGSGSSLRKRHGDIGGDYRINQLPAQLKKLDLQRFPDKKLPRWLWPDNITGLEKLHLGSSRRLKGLGESPLKSPSKCTVKVLRLRCLPKLSVEWRDLTQLYFPKLEFLENYECPRVTFCPCDRDGIWRKEDW